MATAVGALAAGGIALSVWLILGGLKPLWERVFRGGGASASDRLRALPRSAIGMALAHAGIGVIVLGLTGLLTWQTEKDQVMRIGDTVEVAGYTLTLRGIGSHPGPNYVAQRAEFDVAKNGAVVMHVSPEKRAYVDSPQITTEAAIEPTWAGDLYIALGDSDGQGGYAIRAYFKPFVHLLWLGAAIMVLGGVVSLSDRRRRAGAPTKSRASSIPAGARPHAAT